jgi:hypothetical protein
MMKRGGFLFALLLLVACGESVPADNEAAELPAGEVSAPAEAEPSPQPAEAGNAPAPTPDAAVIPAAFRGIWAETEALCADRSHHSRLVVSGATLRFYESVVTVSGVEEPRPREIVVEGSATGEGTTRPAEYHFSINPAGDTLTDEAGGGMVRRRCA